jgi:LacI family transcriptional regulator
MRDVAGTAGVSVKTVSRVVNGERGVRADTAARVDAAIGRLGFTRNDLASSLRRGRAGALGLVIEDVANPFYSAIARAVEDAAHARGHILITGSCEEDPARERQLALRLLRRLVDALLIVPAGAEHRYLLPDLAADVPIVFLDRPPGDIEADTVLLDNLGGTRAGVEHLIGRDPGDELVRTGSHDVPHAQRAVRELLELPPERRPTALFTSNNRNTVGALRALRDAPHRVAIVGFDDFELADMLPTPVTVVRHAPEEMGRIAAELAYARLDDGARPPQRRTIGLELVIRGSGEVPP